MTERCDVRKQGADSLQYFESRNLKCTSSFVSHNRRRGGGWCSDVEYGCTGGTGRAENHCCRHSDAVLTNVSAPLTECSCRTIPPCSDDDTSLNTHASHHPTYCLVPRERQRERERGYMNELMPIDNSKTILYRCKNIQRLFACRIE